MNPQPKTSPPPDISSRRRTEDQLAPAGIPKRERDSAVEENVGFGLGLVAGAAAGAIGGPIGAMVGGAIGCAVGEAAGIALHEQNQLRSGHDRELDDALGSPTAGPAVLDFVDPVHTAAFLRADHDELDVLAESVVSAIAEGDQDDVGAVITELQRRVLAHLEGEERELLPSFAAAHPRDAADLRRDHAALRKALAELDMVTDLHLVRADAVRGLLDKLRAHAAREDASLYVWAAKRRDPA